jgi:uncharacterized protein (TIGR03437 family)
MTSRVGSGNGYVAKYNVSTGKVVYATYLGGSGQEIVHTLTADAGGNAYIAGQTTSSDFPVTPGAYRTEIPNSNAPGFVTKLSPDGSSLVYSTYFDNGVEISGLDPEGSAFVNGAGVLSKLSSDGRRVLSSIRLDLGGFATFDPSGNIVVRGSTISTSFPGVNPLQLLGTPQFPFPNRNCFTDDRRSFTCQHAILGKLDPQGKVIWSSVLGAPGVAGGLGENTSVAGVSVDSSGKIYAAVNNFGLIKVEPVGPAPLLVSASVVSSAGFQRRIAPGGLVSIFGTGLTNAQGVVAARSFPLPTALEGTAVTMGGAAAPILAVANVNGLEQVNVQAPFGLPLSPVMVRRGRALGFAHDLRASDVWPTVFTGHDGQPVITHADYHLVTTGNPARAGETIVIWSTGGGAVTPPVAVGMAAPVSPVSTTVATPVVTIGGQNAPVVFSGLAPGWAGLYQIHVVAPLVTPGARELAVGVRVGTTNLVTDMVTIAIQ